MKPTTPLRDLFLNEAEAATVLAVLQPALSPELFAQVRELLQRLPELAQLLAARELSVQRLQRMLHGAGTEKARRKRGPGDPPPPPRRSRRKGHGRRSHRDYPGGRRIWITNPLYQPGCLCSKSHSDDTTMRVGQLPQEIQAEPKPKRTGIFTTAILGQAGDHAVHLVFTGRRHAGENLARVLDRRQTDLAPPLHMCDGLAANAPPGHVVQECSCNVHGRRNFVELETSFPEAMARVVADLGQVYAVDAECRREQLTPADRLARHQARSGPVMAQLKDWFIAQKEGRTVEPNSGLGQAIDYMLDRWEALTRFLTVAGAPLDNNLAERVLKTAILHRKNSLHYRTVRGAAVGDTFMSVIQTCGANGVNPFDYLVAVARHPAAVADAPDQWLPWNYRDALAAASSSPASN